MFETTNQTGLFMGYSWDIHGIFSSFMAYLWDILMGDSDILILIYYGWLMVSSIFKKYESQWEGFYYTIYCGKSTNQIGLFMAYL